MINFEYIRTQSAKAAIEARAKNKSAQFIAGGTNLVDLMKKGVTAPDRLIDINGLPLKNITADAKGITIGALSLNSSIAEHAAVRSKFPLLSMALEAGASPQLRNMATLGGNILQRTRCTYFYDTTMPCNKRAPGTGCGAKEGYNRMHALFGAGEQCVAVHPSDACVALAVLDAVVLVSGSSGERKIAFKDFHRLPGDNPELDNTLKAGELITAVQLPVNKFNKNYYLKIRDRASYAFALVSAAVALEVSGGIIRSARLAMGGVAHKPWRLPGVEKFLAGKKATAALYREAANLALEGAQPLAHNAFKVKLGKAAILEALSKANAPL